MPDRANSSQSHERKKLAMGMGYKLISLAYAQQPGSLLVLLLLDWFSRRIVRCKTLWIPLNRLGDMTFRKKASTDTAHPLNFSSSWRNWSCCMHCSNWLNTSIERPSIHSRYHQYCKPLVMLEACFPILFQIFSVIWTKLKHPGWQMDCVWFPKVVMYWSVEF
jgi:hypothetical protein